MIGSVVPHQNQSLVFYIFLLSLRNTTTDTFSGVAGSFIDKDGEDELPLTSVILV